MNLTISVKEVTEEGVVLSGTVVGESRHYVMTETVLWMDPPFKVREKFLKEAERIFNVLPSEIKLNYATWRDM